MMSSRFRLSDDTTLTFTRAMVKFEQSEEEAENPPDYRGMRALQQQYQWSHECLDAGGDAYMQGKYRHAVNLFVAAYRQSGGSSGEFSFRYYCVVMVTNALTHAGLDAGERDIMFLKDIMNDEKEEHASRVRAAVVLGVLATNITDAITHHRRALQISVTMSKEHRDARVVGPDPKDTTSFTKDTKLLSPKQGDVVDALALEAKSHLESIVGEGAKELTVPVPFLPPPAPASIVDAPGPAPEDRPKAPGSEEEVKQMAKEDRKRKELEDAQREAMRRENSLLRGRHAMGMENPTMDRLFVAAPDLGIEQTKIDSMLKTLGVQCFMCGECALPNEPHEFCSKCNLACYCSVDCQKRHWKWRHKRECRPKDSFALGDYACLDASKCVDPEEYRQLAEHCGVKHSIWLIVGVLASYDDGATVRVTMDGRDSTSKVFGRHTLCRLPPTAPEFNPQKMPLAPK